MSTPITVSSTEILQHIKLSCRIPSMIEEILTTKIVHDKANSEGINVTPEELQKGADGWRLICNLRRSDETLTWLEKHYLSLDDFEAMVQTNLLSMKLAQHLFGDQVEPFFVEHQLDYMKASFYEVILDDEDLALELFYALQEKETNFAEIAQHYIQDPELRRVGGYRSVIGRSDLKPEISAAIFAAKPSQLLRPITTSKGIHLISVEEIIQPELDMQLRNKILGDLFSKWLKQQIEQIEVTTLL
jgi:hypothetical protein